MRLVIDTVTYIELEALCEFVVEFIKEELKIDPLVTHDRDELQGTSLADEVRLTADWTTGDTDIVLVEGLAAIRALDDTLGTQTSLDDDQRSQVLGAIYKELPRAANTHVKVNE